jgi:large repetitive protein
MHYGEKALACARGPFARLACVKLISAWHCWVGMLVLALSVLTSTPSLAQVRYHYDELGRLIQVVASDGQSAQYSYDAAGNITSIKKLSTTAISISEFTPNAGPVGTSVTLYGTGFNTTATNNTVKFNGTTAVVSAATATSLTVAVPTGATTGVITVTNTNGTATSVSSFVVGVTTLAPTITSFTPNIGTQGTVVTVAGTNFQLAPEDNEATFGAMASIVRKDASSPTATQLKLTVPTETASGKISITTPYGKATSSADFFALPGSVNLSDVEFKGRLVVNGAAVNVTTTVPGKKAVLLFDGQTGQGLHVVTASGTFAGAITAQVYSPQGFLIETLSLPSAGIADFVNLLSWGGSGGTYTIILSPQATDKGTILLSLVADVTGSLTVDGTASAINLSAGRNARYTFSAEAGKGYGLGLTGLSFTPAGGSMSVQLHKPDGTHIASCDFIASDSCNFAPGLFTAAGSYRLVFNPSGSNAASFMVMVSKDTGGPITVDAATASTVNIVREGQNGRYKFNGTAGQSISLVWSANTLSDGNTATNGYAYIALATPGNPDSAVTGVHAYENTATGSLDYTLTATGTYTVIVDPFGLLKGGIALQLKSYVSGILTVDGVGTAINLSQGQNAEYTFAAEAGRGYGLGITGLTFTPTVGLMSVQLQRPDGANLASCNFSASDSCTFPPSMFTAAGNYKLVFNPSGNSTASFTAKLSKDTGGPITVDAATATTVNIGREGQNGRYTFSGTAGQSISVVWSGNTLSDGNTATNHGATVGLATPGNPNWPVIYDAAYENTTTGSLDYTLTATGTYTVIVDPSGLLKGSIGLQVKSYGSGTLTVDGAGTAINLSPGQNAQYTFAAEAGKGYGLGITGLSGGAMSVQLQKPDGASITTCSFGANDSCNFPPSLFTVAGNYKLVFNPSGSSAVNFMAMVSKDTAGTITVDAATATTVNIAREGQNGRYTFSGTAGQFISVVWSGNTLSDGNAATNHYFHIALAPPSNPESMSYIAYPYESAAPGSLDSTLTETGTYTVIIDPRFSQKGTIGLQVKSYASGTLTVDGAGTDINLSLGRKAQYTFAAEAGKGYGLAITGLSAGSLSVQLQRPDGSIIANCPFGADGSCNFAPSLFSAAGNYRLVFRPTGSSAEGYPAISASFRVILSKDTGGPITVDASTATTVNIARAGQNGRYTFSGTAGQPISILWSANTLNGYLFLAAPSNPESAVTTAYPNESTATGSLDYTLTATGTYTLIVDPYGLSKGSIGVRVIKK